MESYERIRNTNLYQAFRSEGFPTLYDENQSNGFFDIEISSMVFIFVSIVFAVLLILPGFRGKERLFVSIRCIIALIIGFCLFICNFENKWERDSVDVTVQYKAGMGQHINATIGLNIGLRGINITLVGIPVKQFGETIKYNEHYSWEWNQGRIGFGPQAGRFHQEYRSSQYRGLPYPILWIAEYFTFDGEGIRFGRHYRLSGWYSHIMVWLSVPLFLLSIILFQMVIQYGALFLVMTGSSLITANILYSTIRNPIPLKIPFEAFKTHETVYLSPQLSWCFYLNLINGIFCIFLGLIAFLSDLRYPDETAEFFGIDVLQSYEDYFADVSNVKTNFVFNSDKKETQTKGEDERGIYAGLRKKHFSNRFSKLQKSSLRKKPMTQPRSFGFELNQGIPQITEQMIETPLYENFQRFEAIEESEENQL